MTSSVRRGVASGCAAMGEPGPGCGVWDLAAVPQPAEPGGARAVLWLTGRAGGGSSASDDGPLSDLGVSGCVFTGKVKSLLEIQPAGKLPLGRGSAPGEHACRRRAAIATIRMTSLRAPAPPGSWPPRSASLDMPASAHGDSGFVCLAWNVFVWFAYRRGSAGRGLPCGSGESSGGWTRLSGA